MLALYHARFRARIVRRLINGSKAGVAKLEYARDLGSRGRETVRVRVPPSAPSIKGREQKAEGSEQFFVTQ